MRDGIMVRGLNLALTVWVMKPHPPSSNLWIQMEHIIPNV